ncbi:MAG: methylmalonyl-CoA mutase family protein [Actinomycetota bacterium]|nr:methylmalonyl-CoA mutase family protein [Actinomycetota bacterium]
MIDELYRPSRPVRFVTAASLFDGHDASINIMRRLLQRQGAEVVHLGHNRSVDDVVSAVVQEDADGVAISSYQGGHVEYFGYLIECLRDQGRGDVKVFGGGGGVIVHAEIDALHEAGVTHIFSPADGQRLGLERMVNTMIEACDRPVPAPSEADVDAALTGDNAALARIISALQADVVPAELHQALAQAASASGAPVLGITGTGGSGKSSLTDELVRRFRLDQDDKLRIAVLAVDPTRRRGGGALLGDRIRMNAIAPERIFVRSLATRGSASELPDKIVEVVQAARAAGFNLIIVETPGIGQGDAGVVDLANVSLYVMTPEFGAASQLEKIDMLDFADVVAINKFERRGGLDALRDVRRVLARSGQHAGVAPEDLPVFGTVASKFNDDGVTALYQDLRTRLAHKGLRVGPSALAAVDTHTSTLSATVVDPARARYLAEIAESVRSYHAHTEAQADRARRRQALRTTAELLGDEGQSRTDVDELAAVIDGQLDGDARRALEEWPELAATWRAETLPAEKLSAEALLAEISPTQTDAGAEVPLRRVSLSGTSVPRVALPRTTDEGDLLRFLRSENLPGRFPYTAGVFPLRRDGEDPARMFAGEGDAARTNQRFKLLAESQPATRLSTAFDSVTLYGYDPAIRPDIYGKVGNSGVSICTLDDMKVLYGGFDLTSPSTSVSMTINGPAPTILAMFLNTAVDQVTDRFEAENGRVPSDEERAEVRERALRTVRGTVQADILKEDQGQNTCIFSTEFSLRAMADVAQWFIDHKVRHFYSVSISGYHIAEAGANPISQLAFTLANGFTYVEAYLARGMNIDDFAPNLSFFFSNGMDPEYTVIGRVARRIWAVAMRDRYEANARSQKLKYHIQTSGRSLHSQEMGYNDIRTTLQALCAHYDNANSLHTNASDEAVTTPSAESVRRALAIQLVIAREWGLARNENPLQGSYIVDELTDLVEEAVLTELDRMSERGGVLGAMETGYQRGKIQDESMLYETRKHDGSLPIVGVNTFLAPEDETEPAALPLSRSTEEEKQGQIARLAEFQKRHAEEAPAMTRRLAQAALAGDNLFEVLMDAVRVLSLGQITDTLFEVGGRYRRSV